VQKQDNAVAAVISNGLKKLKSATNYSLNFMADSVDIQARTFQSYYYGQYVPSVDTVVKICNHFRFSINDILAPLIDTPTEQESIAQIHALASQQAEFKQNKINYALEPIIACMTEGLPVLDGANFGQRVRILREDSGQSLQDIANFCTSTVETIKNIESNQGFPSVQRFCNLCNALHVTPEYLLANELTYLSPEYTSFYSLTPRQLNALSETMLRLYQF